MSGLAEHTYTDNTTEVSPNEQAVGQLLAWGIKGETRQLTELAERYQNDSLTLNVLAAYLKRWYAGRLNGLETIPVLLPDESEKQWHSLHCILAAFENKLGNTSDLTLLHLLSLSDRPVPQHHLQNVFRTTLMERWLTRRDDYVRFLGPLGRLNEEHWHWVVENLRRLQLLEQPVSGQHDLLYVAPPIRQYFRKKLKHRNYQVFTQASADMERLFEDTVVEFKQRYRVAPELRVWMSPELQERMDREAEPEAPKPDIREVFWKQEELDTTESQLVALRQSLNTLKTKTERISRELAKDPAPAASSPGTDSEPIAGQD